MKTPSRDSGDPYIAYGAEPTLELPEKAKCSSTPKRRRHMIRFAFLEVGFVGGVVWVGFAFDLDVSLNGRATGEQQVLGELLCGRSFQSVLCIYRGLGRKENTAAHDASQETQGTRLETME